MSLPKYVDFLIRVTSCPRSQVLRTLIFNEVYELVYDSLVISLIHHKT